MRILFVSGSLTPDICGVGDYTHNLANALAVKTGNEVAVITSISQGSSACQPRRREYEVLRAVKAWTLADLPALYQAMRAWRPDVVHVQYPTQGYRDGWMASLAGPMAALLGARVVRTWHEGFSKGQVFRLLVQSLAPGPYVVVRPDFDRHVSRWLQPLIARRRRLVSGGASAIPVHRLDANERADHRSRWLGDADRLLVYFGFLYPKKGVERLFLAADPATDRIVVVGEDGVDAAYTGHLKSLAASPPWRGRAELTGNLSPEAVANLLAVADAVVLPFIDGGGVWNSSIHAALQQGTPVISTTAGDGFISQDGMINYVASDDEQALKLAVRRIPAWNGVRVAPADDSWDKIARDHQVLYDTLFSTIRRRHQAAL